MNRLTPYFANIEEKTLDNYHYRKVEFTTTHLQLVYMSLIPGEDIPMEVHHGDQFIRVEQGTADIIIDRKLFKLEKDDCVIIPAGAHHYVKNSGDIDLKLYSIYTPPEHSKGHIDEIQPPE